jgi:hypothetical protein
MQLHNDFFGRADETVEIQGEVVNMMTPKADGNYYHWMAEGLSRSVLSFFRKGI